MQFAIVQETQELSGIVLPSSCSFASKTEICLTREEDDMYHDGMTMYMTAFVPS